MTGKTSLFTILTGVHQETRIGSTSVRQGVAKVPDTRLEALGKLFEPPKVTHATVEYVDMPSISKETLVDYMLAIVERTRTHESLALGVSPRGSQALFRAVQALALMEGRDFAIPDDVKRLAAPLFAHRVVVNTRTTLAQRRAEAGERIIEEILSQVEVPL